MKQNEDVNNVSTNGIHYFNTVAPTFYQEWYEDGQLRLKCNLSKGVLNGKYTRWYSNGKFERSGELVNVNRSGYRLEWTDDGSKCFQDSYLVIDTTPKYKTQWRRGSVGWVKEVVAYK